jgi:hypothetical protein
MPRGRPRKDALATRDETPLPVIESEMDDPVDTSVFGGDEEDTLKYANFTPEVRKEKQRLFVEAFRQYQRVDIACRKAGISESIHKYWKRTDEAYVTRCEAARESGVDMMESNLVRMALSDKPQANKMSLTATLAYLNAYAAERYRPRSTVDMNVRVMADYKGFANREEEGK